MAAIYKRELKSYFQSVIGCLFIGATLFMIGLYFTVYNLFYGYPQITYALESVVFLFMLTVPVLTMRILAEERKNKTDQLILTAPVSVGTIVLGKYLALATIYTIPCAIVCMYPLILSQFGSVPMGECYLALLAFYLYGLAAIALGIFVSSLTESVVISAVVTFALLFLGFVMSGITSLISQTGNLLTKFLSIFDMSSRFYDSLEGTLHVDVVIYFLSVIVLMLFLTCQMIQKRRYSVSVKNLSISAYNSTMTIVIVAVVVAVNMVISALPTKYTVWDLTTNKLYSLTQDSIDYVSGLKENVTIYVLNAEGNADTMLTQTLAHYEDLTDKISVEYVDPLVNPKFASQYMDTATTVSRGTVIVESSKRYKVISASQLYESSFDYSTYQSTTTGYDGEGQITSAIAYVVSDEMPKLYMISGHGEAELESSFANLIAKANLDTENLRLMDVDEIPEDASGVLINAPSSDFSEDDADKVIDYLNRGGRVFAVAGYTEEEQTNFQKILQFFDLQAEPGLVLENDENKFYQSPYYLLPDVSASDSLTSAIAGNYYIFTPYAVGIKSQGEDDSVTITPLLTTSDSAFSRTDLSNTHSLTVEEGDVPGPFYIGLEAEKSLDSGSATLLLFSSYVMFTDSADAMVSGANSKLFANCLGTFGTYDAGISIPVKTYEVSTLLMTQRNIILLAVITTAVIPLAFLITGLVVWLRRRKKA